MGVKGDSEWSWMMTLEPPLTTLSWEGCTNQNLCQDQECNSLFIFPSQPIILLFWSLSVLFIPSTQYYRLSNSLLSQEEN